MTNNLLFITAIGSSAGKSHAVGWIARRLLLEGRKVITQKFIQTGCTDGSAPDIDIHRRLMGIAPTPHDRDGITAPIRLAYATEPHIAAVIENAPVDLHIFDKATRKLKKAYDTIIIEGSAGITSPVVDDMTELDFIQNRNLTLAIVVNCAPGTLPATILALEAIRRRNIRLAKVYYNQYFDTVAGEPVARETLRYITRYIRRNFHNVDIDTIPAITDELLEATPKPVLPEPPRKLAISKVDLTELPMVTFPGTITVVDTPKKEAEALAWLSRQKIVGFDTETRPSFRKGRMYPPALVQISTPRRCFLFRINKLGFSPALRKFLEKETIKKVGLSLKDDYNALRRRDPEFEPAGFIDLQDYVKKFDIADLSLQKIYGIIFNKRISKNQRLSNWEADTLAEPQQIYAAIDAWASLRIYQWLEAGKFDPAKSKYLVKE